MTLKKEYRCIGYGITDASGGVTLDKKLDGTDLPASYTGAGVGKIDFVVSTDGPDKISEESNQSEPCEVLDCEFYNSGVGQTGDASFYNPSNITVDMQSDGTLLTQSANSNALYYANLDSTSDLYDFEAPFCMEFDAISHSIDSNASDGCGIHLTEKNKSSKYKAFASLNTTSNNHIKVTVDGTNVIYQVDNNTPITEEYSTTKVRVAFLLNNATLKFKNFMIYPI